MRVVINGAGIAGTTLAYWLCEFGHEVLLVEEAAEPRRGGYILDFWGIGYDVAEKMALIPQLQELCYWADELHLVDRHGRRCGGYRLDVLPRLAKGRFMALSRSDLAATIRAALGERVETVFGDSVARIEDEDTRVRVGFDHAAPRVVDLVVGADGLHSRVRGLAFGEETRFEYALGCHAAAFEAAGYRPADDLSYVAHGDPGRYITRFPVSPTRTFFFMVFRDELLGRDMPSNESEYKPVLKEVFGDMGWECPQILSTMENVDDFYFDSISQIRMDRWTRGRAALVGDAAACPSLLAGEGAGLAMAEAYVLAGEIHGSRGDHRAAFAGYEKRMMPFLRHKQQSAEKLLFAFVPKTALGVAMRNFGTRLMNLPLFPEIFLGSHLHDDIELPNYED